MSIPFESVGGGCWSSNTSRGYLSRGVRGRGRCGYRPRNSAVLEKRIEVPPTGQPAYTSTDSSLSRLSFANIFSNMQPASAENAKLLRAQLSKPDSAVEELSKVETKCAFCNSEKHRSRDCDVFGKKMINSNITCYSCKNPGHYKKDCPNSKNFSKGENSRWNSHMSPHNGPGTRTPHHRTPFVPMPVPSSLVKASAQFRSHLDDSFTPHVREPLPQRPPSTASTPGSSHNQLSDIANDVFFDQMQCKSTFKSGKRLGQEPVPKVAAKFSYCRSDSDEYATDLSISSLDDKKDNGDDMFSTIKESTKEAGLRAVDEKVGSDESVDAIVPTMIFGKETIEKIDADEELVVEVDAESDGMSAQLMEASETGRSDLESENILVLAEKHSDVKKESDDFDKENKKDTVENPLTVKPLTERNAQEDVSSSPATPDEELKKIIVGVEKEGDEAERVDDELSPKMILDFDSESDSNELKNRVESDEDVYGYDGAVFVEEEGEDNLGEHRRNSSTKENEPPTPIEVNALGEEGDNARSK